MAQQWDELRGKIDKGETGDKVATHDPAAAPLGADEEAGGRTTPPEQIAQETQTEATSAPSRDIATAARPGAGPALIYVGVAVVAVLVALWLIP